MHNTYRSSPLGARGAVDAGFAPKSGMCLMCICCMEVVSAYAIRGMLRMDP